MPDCRQSPRASLLSDRPNARVAFGHPTGATAQLYCCMDKEHDSSAQEARHIVLGGRVQGVGFRPFVYRLAHAHQVVGWIRNLTGRVEIFAQGDAPSLDRFAQALLSAAPPLARPEITSSQSAPLSPVTAFAILPSERAEQPEIHVPPDYFACDDCVREMNDPANRRYRYPFINCTQCGPRYTLITRLPYDRANTTMASFPLCEPCLREYENPLDRRFHAEPVACPICGPRLSFVANGTTIAEDNEAALAACVMLLRQGGIVAAKGIGGYHLLCDASNEAAVARLRARKRRPHKPLAIMFPFRGHDGLDAVRAAAALTAEHARVLLDPMRPIVLVPMRANTEVAPSVAPGLGEIGAFLPYSPQHHLLLSDAGGPLVATSANLSGEPVLTNNAEVEARLAQVADAFLHHDRPIARPADDPVIRLIAGDTRPLRLGRGSAPLELTLPVSLPSPMIGVGGHMKNTVALAWGNRVVISPHIGDLDSPRALSVFEQVITDLQALYDVQAERVACDAHPGYASTRWARRSGLPVTSVLHHHAHASALAGEHVDVKRWLIFTWDGVGYGADGTLWGGEALLGRPGAWQRVASFRPFHLPGGEKAGREPWRSALALLWEAGMEWPGCPEDTTVLRAAWHKRLNAPSSSAVGRLFDAAAALTGLNHRSSFEGQGPMLLEAACTQPTEALPLPLDRDTKGIWRSDWSPLLPHLLATTRPTSERARVFHASLAQALADQAGKVRGHEGEFAVGLCGGVFQNAVLSAEAQARLSRMGFDIRLACSVPVNDAAISFGQIVEAGWTASRNR